MNRRYKKAEGIPGFLSIFALTCLYLLINSFAKSRQRRLVMLNLFHAKQLVMISDKANRHVRLSFVILTKFYNNKRIIKIWS